MAQKLLKSDYPSSLCHLTFSVYGESFGLLLSQLINKLSVSRFTFGKLCLETNHICSFLGNFKVAQIFPGCVIGRADGERQAPRGLPVGPNELLRALPRILEGDSWSSVVLT